MKSASSARAIRSAAAASSLESHHKIVRHIRSFVKPRGAKAYIVGGFLRDLLLGRVSQDLDIVVDGIAPEIVAHRLHRDLGFSRPVVFKRFGTALTVGRGIEIEFCRLEGDLGTDADRRDFTVNCMYADISRRAVFTPSAIVDPTSRGRRDLKAGILRAPSDPCLMLWLDPLRILRAIRFYAVLGFSIDRQLLKAMPRMVYLLGRVSPERIRTELETILLSGRLRSALSLMQRIGTGDLIYPELSRTYGFSQDTPHHAYDLFTHAARTAANTPRDLTLRLAGLLHDIGKYDTRTYRRGRAVYYGHEAVSAETAGTVLRRLRFPNRLTDDVVFLIRNHMINYSSDWTDKAVRRFVRRTGPRLEQVLALAEADCKAQRAEPGMTVGIKDLRRRIRALGQDDLIHLDLPVNGRDIMEILGVKEGPAVGRAKDFLLDAAAGRARPMTRQDCVRLLKAWMADSDLA
ncbi:MAG: HDIG domain-containing metalloprotein [Candidatus Eisenbacteria bacterium]